MEVRRVGRYLRTDETGTLSGSADESLIQQDWWPAVADIRQAYLDRWGDRLHSIYLRGSVAKGEALVGVSDIDTFAVFQPQVPDESSAVDEPEVDSWCHSASTALVKRHPYCTGVELSCIPFASALDRDSVFSFVIKTHSVCLHGEDLATRIEAFGLNQKIAFQARRLPAQLVAFRDEYPSESEERKRGTLTWLMRAFLRSGMELVMEREGRYTRDLYLCYQSFARHYPAQSERMWRALELALDPVIDRASEQFALEFGAWLEGQTTEAFSQDRRPD